MSQTHEGEQVEVSHHRTMTQKVFLFVILAAIVGANVWYDYYHPRGIVVDVAIVLYLIVRHGLAYNA
jgi:hypothetical protein